MTPREYTLKPFHRETPLQIDYAKELNPQQCEAVTALPGPALVIAGAGSGKTRTLTYRVAFLLEQGIQPDQILLLTFTNKAAKEMMRRIHDVLGYDLRTLWGGTFHSIGHKILRRHAELLGYKKDFTLLDREDSEDLIKACVPDAGVDAASQLFPAPAVLAGIFSMAANNSMPLEKAINLRFSKIEGFGESIAKVRELYEQRKKSSNVMDFDDLLLLWLKLLKDHEDVRELYQRRFQYVLVDEFQDTNGVQSEVVSLIAAKHHNLMVVGDDSQCIYSWRGADFRNIMEFPKRYPEARVYKIEQNYRSTPEILSVANASIALNVHQFPKHLVSEKRSGPKPAVMQCFDGRAQAQFVAQRILELREEGFSLKDMAVLYRSHFHAMELQLELRFRSIPFQITSGIRFFEQAHVKDVAAFLKWVANPSDELAFKRMVGMMPGVGPKGAGKLWQQFLKQDQLWNPSVPPASDRAGKPVLATALQACANAVPKKAIVSWAQFTATIAQLEDPKLRQKPAEMVGLILEAIYEEYAEAQFENAQARLDDLRQLQEFARSFDSLEHFLTDLALMSNVEAEADKPNEADDEFVRLSTVHQAKGLEFGVVFVIMLCDGLFPSGRGGDSPEHLEEERRLFYVAVTRAKDELYLSYPLIRTTRGQIEERQQPSRFLDEIPEELVDKCVLKQHAIF